VKRRVKFPTLAVAILAAAVMMVSLSLVLAYVSGDEVVMTPKMQMVSHTEYAFSAPGQIIARIVDFQGSPVAVTSCNATILYPNKTVFVNQAGMTAVSPITGDYYYAFTTPAGPEGTYEYQATCYYNPSKNASVTNSFHLTPNANQILANLSLVVGNMTAMQGNLTALSEQLNANVSTIISSLQNVNSTLYTTLLSVNTSVTNLNTQMGANFSYLELLLGGNFTQLNVALGGNFSQLNTALASNFSQVQSNVTQILNAIALANFNSGVTLFFYNTTATTNVSFTVMNLTVPDVNLTMNTTFSTLAVGEHELARRMYDGTVVRLQAGQYTQHTSVLYSTGTRAVRVHSVLYVYHSGNATLTEVGSGTDNVDLTIGAYQDVDFTGIIPSNVVFQPGDYLVMILNATVSGGGSDPTLKLVVGGTTGAGLTLGASILGVGQNVDLTPVLSAIASMNTSVLNAIGALNTSMAANFTYTNSLIGDLNTSMANNFTYTNALIGVLNTSMANNFTYTDALIAAMNASMVQNFNTVQTNFSTVLSYLTTINATVQASSQNYTAILNEINATTQSTYTYVTGTLATNINTILSDLGLMNATLNRIETTTSQINSTVTTILDNQQNQVRMDVFSG